jgi:hypothetical protein
VSRFDATPQRHPANRRDEQDSPIPLADLADEVVPTYPHTNLARGIVWADILAEIAADERARQLRDAA